MRNPHFLADYDVIISVDFNRRRLTNTVTPEVGDLYLVFRDLVLQVQRLVH